MKDITRWDPFKEMRRLWDEVDRLFEDFLSGSRRREIASWVPAVDVEETENEIIVKAEVPGLKKEDIKVSLTEDNLVISGERKEEKEEKAKNYHRKEIFVGKFYRSIPLPVEVQPDKAKATYENGILKIILPKSEKAKPKEIEIEIS